MFVKNNSDSPIIIKLEREGYVILAPGATYTGKDVVGYDYNKKEDVLQKGKIDGIIFEDGRIEKFSDSENLPEKLTVSVTVNADSSVNKTGFVSYFVDAICNIGKFAENIKTWVANVRDGKGLFSREGFKDFSGTYYANNTAEHKTKTGMWVDGELSEQAMKETLNNNKAVFIESKEDLNKLLVSSSPDINKPAAGNNISFRNITFDSSGKVSLLPVTDFSTKLNDITKNIFNINPFNGFAKGCTK